MPGNCVGTVPPPFMGGTVTHHPEPSEFKVSVPGGHRAAVLAECLCSRQVWVGWDDEQAALLAVADTMPLLDAVDEVAVWLDGRRTYRVTPYEGTVRLSVRSEVAQKGGRLRLTIVAEHACREVQS